MIGPTTTISIPNAVDDPRYIDPCEPRAELIGDLKLRFAVLRLGSYVTIHMPGYGENSLVYMEKLRKTLYDAECQLRAELSLSQAAPLPLTDGRGAHEG